MTWTTAYLAALADPAGTPPFMPQPRTFATAEIVRQRVRVLRGGTTLRLVLSNEFGRSEQAIDARLLKIGAVGPAADQARLNAL